MTEPARSPHTRGHAVTEPLLFTVGQAAELLAMSERTVKSLVARGELGSVTQGKLRRITRTDLEQYVERLRRDHDLEQAEHRRSVRRVRVIR